VAFRNLSTSSIINGYKSSKLWDQSTLPGFFESISTVYVASNQLTVQFNNIPQVYSHLQVRAFVAGASAGSTFTTAEMQINGNNLTKNHYLYGNGTSALAGVGGANVVMNIPQAGYANIYATGIIDILDYRNSNKNKTIRTLSGVDTNGAGEITLYSNLYAINTNPITSLSFSISGGQNIAAKSHFALYGIRG
jgi:hypothetical protein